MATTVQHDLESGVTQPLLQQNNCNQPGCSYQTPCPVCQQQTTTTTVYAQPQQQYSQPNYARNNTVVQSHPSMAPQGAPIMAYQPPEKGNFHTGFWDMCAEPGGLLLCVQVWFVPCHVSGRSWEWLSFPGGYFLGAGIWFVCWALSLSFYGVYASNTNGYMWVSFATICFWMTFLLVLLYAFKTFEKMHAGKTLPPFKTCCKAFWCSCCFMCQIRREQLIAEKSVFVGNLYHGPVPQQGMNTTVVVNQHPQNAMVRQEAPNSYTQVQGQQVQQFQGQQVYPSSSQTTNSYPGYAGSDPGRPVYASTASVLTKESAHNEILPVFSASTASVLTKESAHNEILPDRNTCEIRHAQQPAMFSNQENLPIVTGISVPIARQDTPTWGSPVQEEEEEEAVMPPMLSKCFTKPLGEEEEETEEL